MSAQPQQKPEKPHVTTFEVDGEPVETSEKSLTPNQIMGLAEVDSTSHYLVELKGRNQDSYEGRGDEPINVHEKQKFITVATGPTPVS
jgi:hypothetical protein